MTELKTKENSASVSEFLKTIKEDQKREDSKKLVKIFQEATNAKAKMWGESIIGFGKYHYKSERSSQKGDWFLAGFSPRKRAISIYIMAGFSKYEEPLKKLGKHEISSGCCLYIKKLSDVNVPALKRLIKESAKEVKKKYGNK